jgi:FSR family fosmidomycin resistance protein-like MFS transporter
LGILFALSSCHLLNDTIQALLPAIYPLLKSSFSLSFTQIGLITLTFQMVGSIFQPIIGFYTDRHPKPYSLVVGMGITLVGLIALALAPSFSKWAAMPALRWARSWLLALSRVTDAITSFGSHSWPSQA